jgi:predicted CopG family antitoxin
MKSVGLSDGVYEKFLGVKHDYETKENRVISFDEVLEKLIEKNC